MARIQLKNIVKSWGTSVGVKQMSLDIADGEFLVLLGPSGCGKTTTMRMVAGLEDPTAGEIWIGDRCVNGWSRRTATWPWCSRAMACIRT
jgi:multiple sugar transport system ATP-binding protein